MSEYEAESVELQINDKGEWETVGQGSTLKVNHLDLEPLKTTVKQKLVERVCCILKLSIMREFIGLERVSCDVPILKTETGRIHDPDYHDYEGR